MARPKKQRLFVDEYLIDLNATQAAIRAGYSTRRATEIGYQLLQRPEVAQAIQAAMAERSKRTEVEADYVIRRLREIDEMDVLDILEDDGSFRSIRDWPRAWRQFLSGIEIAELFEGRGDDRRIAGVLRKVKWPDKLRNLELLSRHVGTESAALDLELKRLDVAKKRAELKLLENPEDEAPPTRGLVAGFGSGKTWVGCSGLAQHAWEWPRINAGYFAPTYAQIRDIFYPTMEEVAFDWGLRTKINQANHEVHLYSGSAYRTTIICRSMEKPQTIVGFKVGRSLVDELDVLSLVKAQQAWRKIIARMRYKVDGLRNRVDVTTTPEGFKFVFQQFVKQLREKPHLQDLYGLVQASTYDNEANLPDDYIDSLMESYPPQLIAAYLRGQFVNLTSGTIYTA
ncbi:terminase small subunit, partial [Pseudomonas aeruginosa]|uniref:terminase small subunit n=2 Tax=Pseudomonas aeruginosa TaxID=287 RepID=UPI0023DAB01D